MDQKRPSQLAWPASVRFYNQCVEWEGKHLQTTVGSKQPQFRDSGRHVELGSCVLNATGVRPNCFEIAWQGAVWAVLYPPSWLGQPAHLIIAVDALNI